MSDARDELAETIFDLLTAAEELTANRNVTAHAIAGNLLAAGWSKPKVVFSEDGLDELPAGSVLVRNLEDPDELDVYVKRTDQVGWRYLPLPLVVLFTPGGAT